MGFKEYLAAFLASVVCAGAIIATPRAFSKEAPTMVLTTPDGVITLSALPCTEPTITRHMTPRGIALFRAGTFVGKGTTIPLCWALDPENGVVHVTSPALAEQGTTVELPASQFKPGTAV